MTCILPPGQVPLKAYICIYNVCVHGVVIAGYVGIVKDATESTARVELHSSCKTISVDRLRLTNIVYVDLLNKEGGVCVCNIYYRRGNLRLYRKNTPSCWCE